MLDYYFEKPHILRQMRNGPLSEFLDEMSLEFRRYGYARGSVRELLTILGRFNNYLRLTGAQTVTEKELDDFLNEELPSLGIYRNAANALDHLKNHLEKKGVFKKSSKSDQKTETERLLDEFDRHLDELRGLVAATREGYRRGAGRFLFWLKEKGVKPESISGLEILDYVEKQVTLYESRSWKRNLCTDMRVFLRFLHWKGVLASDLSRAVPVVRRYRLSSVPRHLEWEKVGEVIDSIPADHPEGLRDKAIFLLLSELGLRGSEIVYMNLEWLDWPSGTLRIPRTKSRRERILPLPPQSARTLADYILHARPVVESRRVFLRHRAPLGELTTYGAVTSIVRRRLKKAGIESPCYGSRLLRHSLATRLVNTGTPIKEIADVLGQHSIDTTAIYTKVDRSSLDGVALPLPKGGDE